MFEKELVGLVSGVLVLAVLASLSLATNSRVLIVTTTGSDVILVQGIWKKDFCFII